MKKPVSLTAFVLATVFLLAFATGAIATSADQHMKEGWRLMQIQRYAEAARAFEFALQHNPLNQNARQGLDQAKRELGPSYRKSSQRHSTKDHRSPEPLPQRTYAPRPKAAPQTAPAYQQPAAPAPPTPQDSGTEGPGYIKIITSGDGDADDHYRKGNSYMKRKQYEKAVSSYKKAVGAEPKHLKSYLNMGIALKRLKRYDKAVTAYTKALNIDPNYDKAYFNRAVAYKLMGDNSAAAADFKKALEVNPGFTQAKQQLEALGKGTGAISASSKGTISASSKKPSTELLKGIPVAAEKNPDAIAVIIGNRDYQNAKSVDFALNDAWVMKQYLINALGYKEGNVFFVQNAKQSDFALYFGKEGNHKGKLYNAVKEGKSDVFVYYSGHGAPGLKDKRGYFVPVEADPNYIELGGYPADVLYENLSKIPARSITVVLEACFSGATIFENISPMVVEVKNPASGLKKGVVLSSSSGSQVSSWYNEKGHSMFTYFFLKGLQNANADANRDGAVSFEELYSYVSDKTEGVPYYARRIHGVEQDPTLEGDFQGKTLMKY